jgi:serine/threonine protein kinase
MTALRHGEQVGGRYVVEGTLGEGGMAVVYAARSLATGQKCALKVIHARLATRPELRAMFAKEVQVGAVVGPSLHIVDVLDAGFDEALGSPFLVMALLEGETLEARIARGPLPSHEVATLVEQLAEALDQAHEARVVHRDLKPGNLFLARDRKGRVTLKVLDFGIAKALSEEAHKTATQLGTPAYAAPEQAGPTLRRVAQGQGVAIASDVSPQTDVWSLGLIALEALTGVGPTSYWGSTSSADLPAIVTLQPAELASARVGAQAALLPPGFDAWLARCLDRDATRRWPTAGQAAEALRALCGGSAALSATPPPAHGPTETVMGTPLAPTPPSMPTPPSAPFAASTPAYGPSSTPSRAAPTSTELGSAPRIAPAPPSATPRPTKTPALAIAGGVVALGALVAGAYALGRSGEDDAKTDEPAKTAEPAKPPEPAKPLSDQGTLIAIAKGGTCAFSVNGQSMGIATSLRLSVPAGNATVTCKPATGATKLKSIQVKGGATATALFQL